MELENRKINRMIKMLMISLLPWLSVSKGMFAIREKLGRVSTRTLRQKTE